MPRGTKTQILFSEDCYHQVAPCGYYLEGRPKLQQIKLRNHSKYCDVCQFIDKDTLKKMTTKSFFTDKAPLKRVPESLIVGNNNERSIDRNIGSHGEKEVILDVSDKYNEFLEQQAIKGVKDFFESMNDFINRHIKKTKRKARNREKKKRQKARKGK